MKTPSEQNSPQTPERRVFLTSGGSERWFTSHERLAGLPNRQALLAKLRDWRRDRRNADRCLEVLVVDVSERAGAFKYESPYFRDHALVRITDIFHSVVRRADGVYRIGDSRFAVAIENTGAEGSTQAIAARIITEVDKATTGPRQIRVSLGISTTSGSHVTAEDLLEQAEAAACSPSRSSDDQWTHFTDSLRESEPQPSIPITTERLAGAIEREEFSLLFQAIFDTPNLSWRGAEALIRWNDPDLGTVLPDRFLPLAERTGLIGAIGRSVLPELATFAGMARDLSKRDDFFISLNVSQTQLDDPAFSESLRQNMADASFPLANLVVEVTEDFTPIEPGRMTAFSAGLGSADTRFALDDFGRGNWSLDHLWRLPFSILKLDRRLIANIVKSRNDRDLLEDLLARAGEHKLRTIAEGVETAEQVDLLTQMGVDGLQGFQLSTPRSAAESLDLITASAA